MFQLAFLLAAVALPVVPVDVDFCDFCKQVSTDKLPGVGTVEVFDSLPQGEIVIVIDDGHQKVGAHLDLKGAAVRETHKVTGFHDGVVTDRKMTPNNAVAIMFDIERAHGKESIAVTCTTKGCRVVRLGDCKAIAWQPPRLDYTCSLNL
jgi:hypothetical protein